MTSSQAYTALYSRHSCFQSRASTISWVCILALIPAWLQAVVPNLLGSVWRTLKLWLRVFELALLDLWIIYIMTNWFCFLKEACNKEASFLQSWRMWIGHFERLLTAALLKPSRLLLWNCINIYFAKGRTSFPKEGFYCLFHNIASSSHYHTTNASPYISSQH